MKSDLIDVEVALKRETTAAILVNDGDRDVWLPKSQIEYEETKTKGIWTVTLPEWLAQAKDLI